MVTGMCCNDPIILPLRGHESDSGSRDQPMGHAAGISYGIQMELSLRA